MTVMMAQKVASLQDRTDTLRRLKAAIRLETILSRTGSTAHKADVIEALAHIVEALRLKKRAGLKQRFAAELSTTVERWQDWCAQRPKHS